ncbi:hypothetical protein J3T65_11655 [Staphylococcus simiae]|uniref:DUF4440 domain-containing protein n=1 Tax=Staphylococcus simiae TaxID=308354 RepID=UPI001A965B57|nr:DUF4440 domain-containing protein [Staphylococcus simiae]MBO1200008.1 hypothetical protein [Staphylococcus simiae]MBO1202267.1 hypothetical protein [Staphylococcus simiae]MBO1204523.1 hypothetical protein [Staphylococcus simiae]MBO1212068.1 hypothetical protein [Staphylococcus simiae]MBO1230692.1 hypothetical protein [Staphylococcus simiae]
MIKLEHYHLNANNRRSNKYLNILHKDFKEIGKSGKIYTKDELTNKGAIPAFNYKIEQFDQINLTEDTLHCIYLLNNIDNNELTRRSSIWKLESDEWKLFFIKGQ